MSSQHPVPQIRADYEFSSSEDSLVAENRRTEKRSSEVVPIDALPDDVLLAIFDLCVDPFESSRFPLPRFGPITEKAEAWQSLVHVCRRWRRVVFGSPRHLNLQLLCTAKTPARDTLDVWPALPLFIWGKFPIERADNMIAVLEHSDRVSQISLTEVTNDHLERASAVMQEPFPELTHLTLLLSRFETVTGLPDSFLGRSAPRLQLFELDRIPFPGLPKLLLSATHLVTLHLFNIPHSGYISPEAVVTALSSLTSLEFLRLDFQSPLSRPDWASQRLPPPTRSVLPTFTFFWFKGVSEYLEGLVARIDAPRLTHFDITFFNQIIFDTPLFIQFISRTPTLNEFKEAEVDFENRIAKVKFPSQSFPGVTGLTMTISCQEFSWQVSSL